MNSRSFFRRTRQTITLLNDISIRIHKPGYSIILTPPFSKEKASEIPKTMSFRGPHFLDKCEHEIYHWKRDSPGNASKIANKTWFGKSRDIIFDQDTQAMFHGKFTKRHLAKLVGNPLVA